MKFNFVKSKTSIVFIIVLIIILGTAGFFIARQYAKSNVDYICTVTTPIDGACVIPPNGWGPYTPVAGSPGVTQSIGIGTKEVTLVQTYHSRRTSCGTDAVATSKGKSGGTTGWYGFESNVVGAACQVIRYGTISVGGGGGCPEGKVLNSVGDCVAPLPSDFCVNNDKYPGIQNPNSVEYPMPSNVAYDKLYNCHNLLNTVDVCKDSSSYASNDPRLGLNTPHPPTGYKRDGDGFCSIIKAGDVVKIDVDFQCSVDNVIWNDCSRVVLPSRNYPIYLKAADHLVGNAKNWTIEDNDSTPLDSGKSIGSFASNDLNKNNIVGNATPVMKLTFGAGTSFSKLVELAYTGVVNGVSSEGSTKQKINIIIFSDSSIIEN